MQGRGEGGKEGRRERTFEPVRRQTEGRDVPSLRVDQAMHRLAVDHKPDAHPRADSNVSDRGLGGGGGMVGELGEGGSIDVRVEEDGLAAV